MADKESYFEGARSWATDERARDNRTIRIAWIIAGLACGVAVLEALALVALTPLKTVQPVTLLVDRHTGYVQELDPSRPVKVSADQALTNAFLAQYVTAREGFDRATVSLDYRRTGLWSAGRARSAYLASMPATNPASPFQLYPPGTVLRARVKSVSRLNASTALVRFDTQRQDRNGRVDAPSSWISVVRFRYSDAPMRMEDRLLNPLGFQVTGYRKDAEIPPPAEAATAIALDGAPAGIVRSTDQRGSGLRQP